MIYFGYILREYVEFIFFYYGLLFKVGNWFFLKLDYYEDGIVYDCG